VSREVVLEAVKFPAKAPRPSQSLHLHPAFLGVVLEVDLALRVLAKARQLFQLSHLRLVSREVDLEPRALAKAPQPSQSFLPHPAFLGVVLEVVLEVDLALRVLVKARQLFQLSHLRLVSREVVLEAVKFPAKAPRPSQSLRLHPAFLGVVLEVDLALRVLAKARQLFQSSHLRLVSREVVLEAVKFPAKAPRPSQLFRPRPASLEEEPEVALVKAQKPFQLSRPRLVFPEVVLEVAKVLALHPHQVLQEVAVEVVKEAPKALGLSRLLRPRPVLPDLRVPAEFLLSVRSALQHRLYT
jgi:hypothetical protein